MPKSSGLIWGIVMAFAIPIFFFGASILWSVYSYKGECGGYMPWLAGAQPCTLREYVNGNFWLLMVVVFKYWPLVIVAMVLPIAVGLIRHLLDRQNNKYD